VSEPNEQQPPKSERENDAAPQRRGWFRRRLSPRQPAETTAASEPKTPAPAESPPAFAPFGDAPVPASSDVGVTQHPELADAERVESRPARRPRRRSPASAEESTAESTSTDEVSPVEPAGVSEAGRVAEASAAAEIDVNVVVPRGMGRRVNTKLIQQVTRLALQREGWDKPASLDVVIVSDDEMREINATRRGIDEATDVLSFPLLELRPDVGLAEDFFVLPPDAQVHLGDVVISFSRVESQAEEAGHSRERELAFLTVHAVLHILGYDHDTEEKRRRMRRREEDVLTELGLRRNGS
jgi:probable rRNA maturation factor